MSQRALRQLGFALIGIVLVGVLVGLCIQIYRVSTGQTAIYGRPGPVTEATPTPSETPSEIAYAQTDRVHQIVDTQETTAEALGGDENHVTFRSPSGQIACTIATDVSTVDTGGWVPLPANPQGQTAHGPGAVCVGIANLAVHEGDAHPCARGESLRSSVVGVWGEDAGIGVCAPDATKMFADARNHSEGGDRYALPELPYGTHVKVGEYGCTINGAQAVCAHLTSGRGFVLEDNVGYEMLPAAN